MNVNCALSSISNHTNGFDFGNLFTVYLYLNQTCPPGSDIFFANTRTLTDAVCRKITGNSDSIWSGWTPYPISDIWTRIVTWKLPLFQLVSQFPRPPLGFNVEAATLMHLLGDPIDTMTCVILTLSMCRSRVKLAKKICSQAGIVSSHPEYHRIWKGLAIIMVSYDECGKPDAAEEFCADYLFLRKHPDFEAKIRHIYEETASSLAADRRTTSLPVVFAELFFIGGWLISLLKAASSEPNPANWVNVEAHSIAFSALYLWVTSAVVLGSVIGASQTENSIPRLLHAFEYQIAEVRSRPARRPSAASRVEVVWCRVSIDRAAHGGSCSWRPNKWKGLPAEFQVGTGALISFVAIALVAVGSSFLTAAILSYFVAPRGPSCRHIPESLMFVFWVVSCFLEYLFERCLRKSLFWSVFCKDTFFALSNISIILITQWGVMNRCSCWTMWGFAGLNLPQLPEVKLELMNFIRHVAPWIVFMAILLQLIFCAVIAWKYWDAVRVYIQRDDGFSNSCWQNRTVGPKSEEGGRE